MTDSDTATYRPRWWYPAATAVTGLLVVVGVRTIIDVEASLTVIVPAGAAVAVWQTATLRLSSAGVTMLKRTTPWRLVEVRQGRFGESLRTIKSAGSRSDRVNAFLPLYESNWRQGRVGTDLRRWAPQLLASDRPDLATDQ